MAKIIHKNRLFSVEELRIKVRGNRMKAYAAVTRDTIAILPMLKNGCILMERQHRPAINSTIYEIPAGHMEKGERPLAAAKRELEEETGFKANKWTDLKFFYPSPGILARKEYLYLAESLEKGRLKLDKDEEIELKRVSIGSALKMIKSGRIVDGKTILAILYYKNFIDGRKRAT